LARGHRLDLSIDTDTGQGWLYFTTPITASIAGNQSFESRNSHQGPIILHSRYTDNWPKSRLESESGIALADVHIGSCWDTNITRGGYLLLLTWQCLKNLCWKFLFLYLGLPSYVLHRSTKLHASHYHPTMANMQKCFLGFYSNSWFAFLYLFKTKIFLSLKNRLWSAVGDGYQRQHAGKKLSSPM